MGSVCGPSLSEEEKKILTKQRKLNKAIDSAQEKSQNTDEALKKLLLLGAGESGKSTLFKQMITLYGKGYSEAERISYKPVIYSNTIEAMRILIENYDELHDEIDGCKIDAAHEDAANRMRNLIGDEQVVGQIVDDIRNLWFKDPGIKTIFENRAQFQFPDSGPYFFKRLDELSKEDYIPTQQDVLRSRVRTTGIVETSFELEGNVFKMFDVGGQRNERKKWYVLYLKINLFIFCF